MSKDEVIQKLLQIYGSEELEQITGVVSEIPEEVLGPLHDIRKGCNGPQGANGIPARGEYVKETNTIILYDDAFNPNVLFHEIGHSIYHECPEITQITECEYKNDPFYKMETAGEDLSREKGAAEFCANAYQLYKTQTISTDDDPERFRSLAEKLEQNGY